MKLVVGLGNPGPQYARTRHNIGFLTLFAIAQARDLTCTQKKFDSIFFSEKNKLYVLPQTYMNNSGVAVQNFSSFFKINSSDIIVIHDDIDLELGKIKVKIGGGHGGHNGLKSIDQHIGNNYLRVRLGIGKQPYIDTADYVLQNFTRNEMIVVEKMILFVTAKIDDLLKDNVSADDISTFLTSYNKLFQV